MLFVWISLRSPLVSVYSNLENECDAEGFKFRDVRGGEAAPGEVAGRVEREANEGGGRKQSRQPPT